MALVEILEAFDASIQQAMSVDAITTAAEKLGLGESVHIPYPDVERTPRSDLQFLELVEACLPQAYLFKIERYTVLENKLEYVKLTRIGVSKRD